jgi:hypothetical protein
MNLRTSALSPEHFPTIFYPRMTRMQEGKHAYDFLSLKRSPPPDPDIGKAI